MKNAEEVAKEIADYKNDSVFTDNGTTLVDFEALRDQIAAALKDYAEERYMEGYRHSKEPGDIKAREQAVQILRELSFKEGFREGVEKAAKVADRWMGDEYDIGEIIGGAIRALLPPSEEKE